MSGIDFLARRLPVDGEAELLKVRELADYDTLSFFEHMLRDLLTFEIVPAVLAPPLNTMAYRSSPSPTLL